ncbi:unnamed protein product, partial [Mesorhabditis belari]|uniref:DNA/RNA-binding domain-containing protein n=1 Tax=Mesorhabditis belari TaxID=2138241 RepID=A0AAF3FEW5_9BILA
MDVEIQFENLLSNLHQLEKFVDRPELGTNYVLPTVEILLNAAKINAEIFLSKALQQKLWKTIKLLIDDVSQNSKDNNRKYNLINVCNMALCWLVDLSLLVQTECGFQFSAAPMFLVANKALYVPYPQRLSSSYRRRFESFICLRVGDLFRYKSEHDTADRLYAASVSAIPFIGDAWNQRGLVAMLRGDTLSALYYHYRAIYCKFPFLAASSNIQRILEKYSNEVVVVKSSYDERYLHALSYSHFLFPINREIIDSLINESISVERLTCFICVLSELGDSKDEKGISDTIQHLIDGIIDFIATKDSCSQEDFLTLALCLRVCSQEVLQSKNVDCLMQKLKEKQVSIEDVHHLRCLLSFDNPLPYPLNSTDILNVLSAIRDGTQRNKIPLPLKENESALAIKATTNKSRKPDVSVEPFKNEEGKDYKSINQLDDNTQGGSRRVFHEELEDVIDLPCSSDEEIE